jgi:hypothetical protein
MQNGGSSAAQVACMHTLYKSILLSPHMLLALAQNNFRGWKIYYSSAVHWHTGAVKLCSGTKGGSWQTHFQGLLHMHTSNVLQAMCQCEPKAIDTTACASCHGLMHMQKPHTNVNAKNSAGVAPGGLQPWSEVLALPCVCLQKKKKI